MYVYIHVYIYPCIRMFVCIHMCNMYMCVGVYMYMIICGCMFIFLMEQIFKKYDRPISSTLAFILFKNCFVLWLTILTRDPLMCRQEAAHSQPGCPKAPSCVMHVFVFFTPFGETEETLNAHLYMDGAAGDFVLCFSRPDLEPWTLHF